MKRTTILLPDDLASLLDRERRRRGVSMAEVVRAALAAHFNVASNQPRRLGFVALGESDVTDLGTNDEHYLDLGWGSQEFFDQTMGRYVDSSIDRPADDKPLSRQSTFPESPIESPGDHESSSDSAPSA